MVPVNHLCLQATLRVLAPGDVSLCQAWSWCDEYLLENTALRILTQSI